MRRNKKTTDRLIAALLESESITQAAQKAKVSRQHAHKLLRDPDFAKALREARATAHGHAMSRLCHLSGKAVGVLESALDGADIPKGKFLAARAVLQFAAEAVGADIEQRLAEIEEQIEQLAQVNT